MPMGQYTQLEPVRTWYDERGEGAALVLMHGGLVDAQFFAPNTGPLAERFRVLTPGTAGTWTPPMWKSRSHTS